MILYGKKIFLPVYNQSHFFIQSCFIVKFFSKFSISFIVYSLIKFLIYKKKIPVPFFNFTLIHFKGVPLYYNTLF